MLLIGWGDRNADQRPVSVDGSQVGVLIQPRWHERATLAISEQTWLFRPVPPPRPRSLSDFMAENQPWRAEQPEGQVLATARWKYWTNRWYVEAPIGTLSMHERRLRSWWPVTLDDADIGEVTVDACLRENSCQVDVDDDVPLWLQVFLGWLALRPQVGPGGVVG